MEEKQTIETIELQENIPVGNACCGKWIRMPIWKVCMRILPGWSPGSRQMRQFMKSGFLYVKAVIT